jgi:hypothetical protein
MARCAGSSGPNRSSRSRRWSTGPRSPWCYGTAKAGELLARVRGIDLAPDERRRAAAALDNAADLDTAVTA